MGPNDVSLVNTNGVPLAPRHRQKGLRITAGATASAPVALPGEPGDIASIWVMGAHAVQFLITDSVMVLADNTCEGVASLDKELFVVPNVTGKANLISVISPDGDSVVVINCHQRGT